MLNKISKDYSIYLTPLLNLSTLCIIYDFWPIISCFFISRAAYQYCVNVHRSQKHALHKVIVVIVGRAHCFMITFTLKIVKLRSIGIIHVLWKMLCEGPPKGGKFKNWKVLEISEFPVCLKMFSNLKGLLSLKMQSIYVHYVFFS